MAQSFGVGSVVAKIEADIRDFSSKMNTVRDTFNEMEENGFNNNAVLGALGAAFTTVGLAGAAAMKKVTDEAREYNDAFTGLQLSSGAVGDGMQDLANSTRDLFRKGLGDSYSEVGNALAFADAHFDGTNEKIEKMTENALRFQNSLGLDPNNVLRAVSRGEYYFNEDGENIYDVLLAMMQITGENEAEIVSLLTEYSSDYSRLGYSINDFGDKAIYGMQNGAKSIGDIMAIYRQFRNNVETMNDDLMRGLILLDFDPNQVLSNIAQGGEIAKKQVDAVIQAIGGLEDGVLQRRLMSSMFGATEEGVGSDFFKNYAKSFNMDVGYNGLFEEFMGRFEDENLNHNIRELQASIKDIMTSVGKEFIPVLTELTQILTKIVNFVGDMHRQHPILSKITAVLLTITTVVGLVGGAIFFGVMAWNMFGGAIKGTITTIGKLLNKLKPLLNIFKGGKFTTFLTGTLGTVLSIIGAAIVGLGTAYKIYMNIKKELGEGAAAKYLTYIAGPFYWILSSVINLIKLLVEEVPKAIKFVADNFMELAGVIFRTMTLPQQLMKNLFTGETLNPLEIISGSGGNTVNIYPNNMDQTNAGSVGQRAARELRGQSLGMI
ncbi:hypothetical protein KK120_18595 [Virgibacillus dakarensis]|nr:hypothetical protein [Virgibacillus dakarensis]